MGSPCVNDKLRIILSTIFAEDDEPSNSFIKNRHGSFSKSNLNFSKGMDFPFFLLLRLASKYLIESISLSQLLQCAFFVFRFEVRTIAHFGQHIQLQGFSRAKSFPLIFLSIILGQKTQEQLLLSSRTSIFRVCQ